MYIHNMNAEETLPALSVPRPERFTGEPRLTERPDGKGYQSATWTVDHSAPEGFRADETWLCGYCMVEPMHWITIKIVGNSTSCVDIKAPKDPAAEIEAAVAFLRSRHG